MKLRVLTPKRTPLREQSIPEAIEDIFKKNMIKAVNFAKRNVTGGGKSRKKLNVRSGRLRSSLNWHYQRDGLTHKGIIGSNVIYARIHEEGGTIRPVSRQWLTIPLQAVKTKAGVTRWGAGDLGAARTFVKQLKDGRLFIFGKVGKDRIVPLFRLVRQVEIPPRPYLRPALLSIVPMVMKEIGQRVIKTAVRRQAAARA